MTDPEALRRIVAPAGQDVTDMVKRLRGVVMHEAADLLESLAARLAEAQRESGIYYRACREIASYYQSADDTRARQLRDIAKSAIEDAARASRAEKGETR